LPFQILPLSFFASDPRDISPTNLKHNLLSHLLVERASFHVQQVDEPLIALYDFLDHSQTF